MPILKIHLYADDTQLILLFTALDFSHSITNLEITIACHHHHHHHHHQHHRLIVHLNIKRVKMTIDKPLYNVRNGLISQNDWLYLTKSIKSLISQNKS